MLTNGFPEEIKRLCSLICDAHPWFVWLHTGSETCFISEKGIRRCTPEERSLLKNLPAAQTAETFLLPSGHVLESIFAIGQANKLTFLQTVTTETTFLVAAPGNGISTERLTALILDRQREWSLRLQLSRLIEQQQQHIRQLEERCSTLLLQRESHLRQLFSDWTAKQLPITVLFDAGIFSAADPVISDNQLLAQLDNALRLAQFAQPGKLAYQLTAAHLQPIERTNTAMPAPLSTNQRVELLLDKYEASARLAQQNGLAVNGKTIAGHLQPTVSPPAITDALKKNRKAIGQLLGQYPEKWTLLRKYLKPVKELSERRLYS